MKIIKSLLLIAIGLLIGFCLQNYRFRQNQNEIDELFSKDLAYIHMCNVMHNGDDTSYVFLASEYSFDNLVYTIAMANTYNNGDACYDFYAMNVNWFTWNGYKVDTLTIHQAISFLTRGTELRDPSCADELSKLYSEGTYVPKDTALANKYKRIADILDNEK